MSRSSADANTIALTLRVIIISRYFTDYEAWAQSEAKRALGLHATEISHWERGQYKESGGLG